MISIVDLIRVIIHHPFLSLVAAIFLLALYLIHLNTALGWVPKEAHQVAPRRWTEEEIRSTYQQICEQPVDFTPHLPPRLDRRYVVVGGSGLVGGFIVLHLLQRGQAPESIRIVDFQKPGRDDMTKGQAASIPFVQADVTSASSVHAAFSQPWDASVASLPLTVYHTAAVMRFSERAEIFLPRCSVVNVGGTENVLAAAKDAGADVFVATSTGSLALRPVNFWVAPWVRAPRGMFQFYPDPDKDSAVRSHGEYFGNYAYSKALAERAVLDANSEKFRTGCIRPVCSVYGNKHDVLVGTYLKMGVVPSWIPNVVQNFVYAENVSLSHLLFESALLKSSKASGRAFAITDPNPPITFGDLYKALTTLSAFRVQILPPLPLFLFSYLLEGYCIALAKIPLLAKFCSEPGHPLHNLQPALFPVTAIHQIASIAQAEASVEKGGLGYRGGVTSLEAMCWQVKQWNDELAAHGDRQDTTPTIIKEIKNIGAAPGA